MSQLRNINDIVTSSLCSGCGGCSGICPGKAIYMKHNYAGYLVAEVENDRCIDCGICREICPSNPGNSQFLTTTDMFCGKCIAGYVGYATDSVIRQKAQSGGIVTALLCYLRDSNKIDGAVLSRFNQDTRRPEAVYESSYDGILQCAGSYYAQSAVVKSILGNRENNIAAVTLGCQSQCLRLIQSKYPKYDTPQYNIGLICSGQYSGRYIDDLIRQAGCSDRQVYQFRFKDKDAGGWPGNVKIYTTGRNVILNKRLRTQLKPLYKAHPCLLCYDQENIFSDISVGDPWRIKCDNKKLGNTVVIVRTQRGQNLIESAITAGYIQAKKIPLKLIIKSHLIDTLKTNFISAIRLYEKSGKQIPCDSNIFNGIAFQPANKSNLKAIKRNLIFSERIFSENSPHKHSRMVQIKKLQIHIAKYRNQLLSIVGKIIRKIYRKISYWSSKNIANIS